MDKILNLFWKNKMDKLYQKYLITVNKRKNYKIKVNLEMYEEDSEEIKDKTSEIYSGNISNKGTIENKKYELKQYGRLLYKIEKVIMKYINKKVKNEMNKELHDEFMKHKVGREGVPLTKKLTEKECLELLKKLGEMSGINVKDDEEDFKEKQKEYQKMINNREKTIKEETQRQEKILEETNFENLFKEG